MNRFWSKVKIEKPSGCWQWTASRTSFGYGKFSLEHGRWRFAHRVSWMLAHGDIPDGMLVLHRCDNPACVRPSHLFLGTPKDNTQDMMKKGRHRGGKRGATNVRARLTTEAVAEIRARYSATRHLPQKDPRRVTMNQLQAEYSVGHATIFNVVHNVSWRDD